MMNTCNKAKVLEKKQVRLKLASIRNSISSARREEAKEALCSTLYPLLAPYRSILSFHSLPLEIDTSALNYTLASEGRLLLPKVEDERLDLFHVSQLDKQLAVFSWNCLEPKPEECVPGSLDAIDCVIVPALGFDPLYMRIGYGKGYYDRLISHAKHASLKTHFIGIGFHEQLCSKELPTQLHDRSVDELFLF